MPRKPTQTSSLSPKRLSRTQRRLPEGPADGRSLTENPLKSKSNARNGPNGDWLSYGNTKACRIRRLNFLMLYVRISSRSDQQGIFDWPQDGIDPLKVLGMSLEDLDPIRSDCKVYILFSRNYSVRVRHYISNTRCYACLVMNPPLSKKLSREYTIFTRSVPRYLGQV